ncbi:hypothetical protein FA95DRAFT_1611917 [Auriscalpium vulgare]|uniref:Uncharacterized protein n=1 Tax=Auriscalpium vulgare TaxID=40419 RepID=A0ACB8R8E7_9AGAM|nr:hypothetical protein FA95DRAFT_1611917 [Auriscalpium vulgare]
MARITIDPHSVPAPEFTDEDIQDLFDDPVPDMPAARARLMASWKKTNDRQKEAWDNQVAEDAQIEADRLAQAQQTADAEKQAAELARREAEAKRPKAGGYARAQTNSRAVADDPAPYAMERMRKFKTVALDYFTPNGCKTFSPRADAESEPPGFTIPGSTLTLQSSHKPSPNARSDRDLSWVDFMVAAPQYIAVMEKTGWPAEHIEDLQKFFHQIFNHPILRTDPAHGTKILLRFAEEQRYMWINSLGQSSSFNIALWSEDLFREARRIYYEEIQAKERSETAQDRALVAKDRAQYVPFPLLFLVESR